MTVSADRYTSEFFAAPSPDGQRVAFRARGNSAGQWWRKGHSHLDESELWLMHDAATPRYEQLTERGAKQMWPMWTRRRQEPVLRLRSQWRAEPVAAHARCGPAAGHALHRRPRAVAHHLLRRPDDRVRARLRDLEDGHVGRPCSASADRQARCAGDAAARSRDAQQRVPGSLDLARWPQSGVRRPRRNLGGRLHETAATPSASPAASRASRRSSWTPDSRRIVYVSERNGIGQLFLYDFTTSGETQLTSATLGDSAPVVSPDGKTLAFVRDGKELRALDLASKQERVLAKGHLSRSNRGLAWSPDNRWIAYIGVTNPSFRNIFAVPAGRRREPRRHRDAQRQRQQRSWSPDGTYIIFNTNQRTEPGEAVRVDLILKTPRFREDRFRDLFRDEPPRAGGRREPGRQTKRRVRRRRTPVDIVFDDIRRRLSILPVGVDVNAQSISPDGRSLLLTATAEGQQNLYVYSLDELSREPAVARQLTSTAGAKADAQFTPDSREVFYLEQGRITVIPIETRQARDRRGDRRDRRRLRAREARGVPAGVDLHARRVLRRQVPRRRLGRRAPQLRAAHCRRAVARRDAATAEPDGRRAERVAYGRVGPAGGGGNQPSVGKLGAALRSRRVRNRTAASR